MSNEVNVLVILEEF